MKSKGLLAALGALVVSFVMVAPAFAITVSCPGSSVPVVDSVDRHYDGATGQWTTIILYHCVAQKDTPSGQA